MSSMAQSRQPPTTLFTEPGASECPSDEDLLAFARGKLIPERLLDIETHLDTCGTCQRVLAEAAHALATAVTSPLLEVGADDWNTTFRRGALVDGRYVIQRFITRGGMGEVYEAFDRKLSQRVALKTVTSTAGDNERAVRRLKAEVQLARLVSHPNVCRIYDLGTHVLPGAGGEIHFLTMEFVEGETLGQRVRLAGPLPVAEAKKVTRDLLLGLRAAHAANVLHRDFKSDNVMLSSGDAGGRRAIVLDFGLARALGGHDSSSLSHSDLVGTFGYIAPEQLEGRPHTRASDLYSFGVVWFESLTGQMPFDNEPSSTARVRKSFRGDVPPPSHVNPELPSELDALVLRCLERDPLNRFHSVDQLLDALDELDAPRRRSRPKLIAAVCVGSVAMAGTGWLLHSAQPPRAALISAAEQRETSTRAPERSGASVPPAPLEPRAAASSKTELQPMAASVLVAPSSRDSAPPRRQPLARPAKSTPRVANSTPRPMLAPTAPSAPTAPRTPLRNSPVSAPAAAPPNDRLLPDPLPPRPRKPDWENPFGAIQPAAPAGTAT